MRGDDQEDHGAMWSYVPMERRPPERPVAIYGTATAQSGERAGQDFDRPFHFPLSTWCARQESNLRPLASEANALSS